jgi:hypothetical protein
MTNVYKDHVLVLPEDDANRQIAMGFCLKVDFQRAIQVLPVAGGWTHVRDKLKSEYVDYLTRYPKARLVLLVDFDEKDNRAEHVRGEVEEAILERVFVLGAFSEPERVRQALGCTLEQLGTKLADECAAGTRVTWDHELLRHNSPEIARLVERVRPLLFEASRS